MKLVRGCPDADVQSTFIRQSAEPFAAIVVTTDKPERLRSQTEHGCVIEHASMRITQRRVDHLPHSQLADIARHGCLEQKFGVRTCNFELSQRGQIHHTGFCPAGPVFGNRTKAFKIRRQPEAFIFDEFRAQRFKAIVKTALARHDR